MKRLLIGQLKPGMVLAQDVFVSVESGAAILPKGVTLTAHVLERLRSWRVDYAFVAEEADAPSAAPGEAARVAELVRNVKNKVKPAAPVVSEELRREALDALKNIFAAAVPGQSGPDTKRLVKDLGGVVDRLVESVSCAKNAMLNIYDLKSYDDYTYHHSLSVAVLAIGLAQYMGYSGSRLNALGLSAILHDIGKTAIPVGIIRKPAKLTDSEFSLVKTHPAAGWTYLTEASLGSEAVRRGILHHHEKYNGNGYPGHLRGTDIPAFSRIIAVADVYDALTSQRPYRKPLQPAEAIEYIMGGSGADFDFDVVAALVKKADLYPRGRVLEFSDGQYALVLSNENPLRPVVELLGSGRVVDLYTDRAYLSTVIKRLLPAAGQGVQPQAQRHERVLTDNAGI